MTFLKKISSSALADADLVTGYQRSGDLELIAILYQRYIDLVYGVCLKYLSDGESAKDAVMNIFEELVTKLKIHQVENFKGWLHAVAKNHCLMQLRSAKKIKITSLSETIVQLEETLHLNGVMETEARLEKMTACIQSLSGEQQQCIQLFYLQNKSYNEIVSATGFDWKTVRSHIQNGRRNLKICMEKTEQPLGEIRDSKDKLTITNMLKPEN